MEIIQIAKSLIGFRTISLRKDEINKCMRFIKKSVKQNGNVVFKEYERNGVKSLLFGFNNIFEPELILCGHVDVVDAKDRQFTAKVRNQKLYGRGAIDMKGPTAVLNCRSFA